LRYCCDSDGEFFPQEQIGLIYTYPTGVPADGEYPVNPNGSLQDIAGIIYPDGTVLGLMHYPENHIYNYHHPNGTRGESGCMGVKLFENGLKMA
jgi:phosphoribosylformylglycinamidine synthase